MMDENDLPITVGYGNVSKNSGSSSRKDGRHRQHVKSKQPTRKKSFYPVYGETSHDSVDEITGPYVNLAINAEGSEEDDDISSQQLANMTLAEEQEEQEDQDEQEEEDNISSQQFPNTALAGSTQDPYPISAGQYSTQNNPRDNFMVIQKPDRFFKPGRVFKCMWTEPASDTADHESRYTTVGSKGGKVYSKLRRFVVVKQNKRSCICVSLWTYGGRGLSKPGVQTEEHAMVYDSRKHPPTNIKSAARPMAIIVENGESISAASVINFSSVYTVEYNIKVSKVGRISDVNQLTNSWKMIMGFGSSPEPSQARLLTPRTAYSGSLKGVSETELEPHIGYDHDDSYAFGTAINGSYDSYEYAQSDRAKISGWIDANGVYHPNNHAFINDPAQPGLYGAQIPIGLEDNDPDYPQNYRHGHISSQRGGSQAQTPARPDPNDLEYYENHESQTDLFQYGDNFAYPNEEPTSYPERSSASRRNRR